MFGFAFFVQYAVGWIIDFYPQTTGGGYAPEGYRMAFGIVLGLQLLAVAWFYANRRRLRAAEPARPLPLAVADQGTRSWATGPAS